MNENEIKDRINNFLDNKKIENPFLRECVAEFVEGHDTLFGDIVSAEDFFKRLEENLDKITFVGKKGSELGEYIKVNEEFEVQNEILIYADESDLEISELDQKNFDIYTKEDKEKLLQQRDNRRSEIKDTVIHELTHAVYTKEMEYGLGYSHIFQDTCKDYLADTGLNIRQSKLINTGKGYYVEGITNYISSSIREGGETYKYQTKAIQMLADKIGKESIIKSAWESNEDILRTGYINSIGDSKEDGEKSYESFDKDMKQLAVIEGERDISRYYQRANEVIEHMQQLLEGKTISPRHEGIKEIHRISREENSISKIGFEDVVNSDVRKSWINRATQYVKNKYRGIKAKENEVKENEGDEIDR